MDRNVSGEGIQVQTGQKVAARKIPKLIPSTYLEFSALDHCENFLTKKKRERERERENEALERRCVCCFISDISASKKISTLIPLVYSPFHADASFICTVLSLFGLAVTVQWNMTEG